MRRWHGVGCRDLKEQQIQKIEGKIRVCEDRPGTNRKNYRFGTGTKAIGCGAEGVKLSLRGKHRQERRMRTEQYCPESLERRREARRQ